jgi:hypothetical protein
MPRNPYRPLVLFAGAVALSLCLVRPALADPSDDGSSGADIVVPASVHAAEARSQRELFVMADTGLATDFDIRDVALFEASLPHDTADPVASDRAQAACAAASADELEPPLTSAAEFDGPPFDAALFEAALPRDVPAPMAHDLAVASAQEDEPPQISVAKLEIPDSDVALFEAALPRDISVPAARGPAIATLAVARPREGKPPLKSAASHPRNKTPAAKQPLRSAAARGKTNDAAGTSRPAPRSVAAAAPPATIPHARPRAGKADHGPRELLIARVPPSDRDEVMPAQRLIPVIRLPLPSPSLALK